MTIRLTIRKGAEPGKTVEIRTGELTIGRDDSCDLTIIDGRVSRKHAFLEVLPDGRTVLHDLRSRNGTYVDGRQVRSAVLTGGEQLRFGDTEVLSSVADPPHRDGDHAPPPLSPPERGLSATPPTVTSPRAAEPAPPPAVMPPPRAATPPPPPAATPPPRPDAPTPSAIQRIVLQRSVHRATFIGIVAIVAVIALAVLLATGLLTSGRNGAAQDPAHVVAQVAPSTVLVVADDERGTAARGTGWVWDASRGLIVTNAHVTAVGSLYTVGTGEKMTIQRDPLRRLVAGPGARSATLRGQALCEDIAVVQVSGKSGLKTLARFPSQAKLKIGERVVAVGYPATESFLQNPQFGANLTGDTGVVSQPETTFPAIAGTNGGPPTGPYRDVVLTDTAINSGNSGGPLVDYRGRLVGMNTATRQGAQGQNYAIGVDRINQVVPKLLAGQTVCG